MMDWRTKTKDPLFLPGISGAGYLAVGRVGKVKRMQREGSKKKFEKRTWKEVGVAMNAGKAKSPSSRVYE
jgi:hypothetical protein